MANLKHLLNTTIGVKIKYENIIKRLVENEGCRDLVLKIIEQVQNPDGAPYNSAHNISASSTPTLKNQQALNMSMT